MRFRRRRRVSRNRFGGTRTRVRRGRSRRRGGSRLRRIGFRM